MAKSSVEDAPVKVARSKHDHYILTVSGSGFGDRAGAVLVYDGNDTEVRHVNVVSWGDQKVVVEVPDAAMGGTSGGVMVGQACAVIVVPAQGVYFPFDMPKGE